MKKKRQRKIKSPVIHKEEPEEIGLFALFDDPATEKVKDDDKIKVEEDQKTIKSNVIEEASLYKGKNQMQVNLSPFIVLCMLLMLANSLIVNKFFETDEA